MPTTQGLEVVLVVVVAGHDVIDLIGRGLTVATV
ncbi:hypothetical protein GMYAFLOJ_CDS0083 [Microbacterium phage phiMiGM15]